VKKFKNYKYRIAFGMVVMLFFVGCALLTNARTNNLFIPDMIGVIIVIMAIIFIWGKFHLGTWTRRLNRPDQ